MTGWGWVGMTLSSLLFIALLLGAGALLIRLAAQPGHGAEQHRSPEQLLAERFARGELSDEQFRQQLATLRDTGALTR